MLGKLLADLKKKPEDLSVVKETVSGEGSDDGKKLLKTPVALLNFAL
jgi:hypothetical protein